MTEKAYKYPMKTTHNLLLLAIFSYFNKDSGFWIWISFFRHIYANYASDQPVVSSGGNRSTRRKPPSNSKSLATFSHAQAGIRTQTVVRDSVQSVAAP